MSDREPDPIARRARALLDRSAEELDPPTRARLAAARRTALDGLDRTSAFGARRAALGTAAAAGAAALVFGVSRWLRAPPAAIASADDLEDVEILAGTDDLELYDDLDFYRWLDDTEPI